MLFKRYYCSKCGTKLKKEKTHRIVSKDDKDYYHYHDAGTFPKADCDVYDYRLQCPACESRVTMEEQRILALIQRKNHSRILSAHEIRADYEEYRQINSKRVLIRNIFSAISFIVVAIALYYWFSKDKSLSNLGPMFLLMVVFGVISIIRAVRHHRGESFGKYDASYSYEEEARLKKLHCYSTHNKKWVDTADQCYCFYCKRRINAADITEYADDGQTALCPKCGVDSLLPDSIEEAVDAITVSLMHEYWF